jgi:hypothetical protein
MLNSKREYDEKNMPRQAMTIIANMPHHIVQRGHNKQAAFFETADYKNYLENLLVCRLTCVGLYVPVQTRGYLPLLSTFKLSH